MEGNHLLVSANRMERRSVFVTVDRRYHRTSVLSVVSVTVAGPPVFVPIGSVCCTRQCLVGQGVPILLAAGKIRACLTHLHVGQTLCDRSLLIACVDPVLGSKYAQIQKLFGLDDFYLQSYFFVSQGEFMAILILVTIQQRQWQWKTLV